MKHKILNSSFSNTKLCLLGYTRLPVINEKKLIKLYGFYKDELSVNAPYYNSILSEEYTTRLQHYTTINKILSEYLECNLLPFKVIIATFFVKAKNLKQHVGLHIDPTVVNALEYDDFIIWIPLVDTTIKNSGRIQIVPFSHFTQRKLNFENQKYFNYDINNKTNNRVLNVNLKAGEPVIFFNNMIHGSEINTYYDNRPAVSLKVSIKDAQLASFYINNWDEKRVDIYLEEDELYYLKHGWNEDAVSVSGKLYKSITLK